MWGSIFTGRRLRMYQASDRNGLPYVSFEASSMVPQHDGVMTLAFALR
jgi:hypothetical protein